MEEKRKRVYMILIFVILLIIGIVVKFTVLDNSENFDEPINDQETIDTDYNETDNEQKVAKEDAVIIKNDNYNYEVDESLKINIREEVMQYVPKEEFVNLMKEFLSENQLMTKDTTITNDGTVNINYATGEVTFVVFVNNSQQTSITVIVKDKKEVSFLY